MNRKHSKSRGNAQGVIRMISLNTPSVMAIDREIWKEQLHLSNFVNTYYQYRDLKLCLAHLRQFDFIFASFC
jgi:hypothetical protein